MQLPDVQRLTRRDSFKLSRRRMRSALSVNVKGDFKMTYAVQFEQMPLVAKMFVVFVGGAALMFVGLVGMTLILVILKVLIFGVC